MFKKLKKIFMFLLVLPVMFVFGACKKDNNNNDKGSKPPIVTPPGPGTGGGEEPAPEAETYSVSFDYALPEGYQIIANSSVTKNVGETVALPTISDANLNQYFLGWANKSDNELLDSDFVSGTKDQTVELVAKWNESALKNYYYTPGLSFEVTKDFSDTTIVSVVEYTGSSKKVILPKLYKVDATAEYPVRMIAENCFNNSSVIESVTYSSQGLIIGKNAFANTKITSFDFSNVMYVDDYAFYGSMLTEVEFGALTQAVNDFAFYSCKELVSVDFSSVTSLTKINESVFKKCSKLSDVVLSNTIIKIEGNAFSECVALENVDFLANVKEIGEQAFNGCVAVNSVTITNKTTSIASTAFNGCNVENLSVYSLFAHTDFHNYSSVFGGLTSAKVLTILGEEVTKIPSNYFYGASALETIVIPDSVLEIGEFAFAGCEKLADITFPNNLNIATFKTNAVKDTAWFKSLNDVTYVGLNLFYVPLDFSGEIEIREGTKTIAAGVFSWRESVTSIKIPASLELISEKAFDSCTNLEIVIFASGSKLKTIGEQAFRKCYALTSINLEVCDELTTIKSSAFSNAFVAGQSSITLPKNLASIEEGAFMDAKLSSFAVAADAVNFSAEDGVLFNKDKTELILYPEVKIDDVYDMPASVELVKTYAFSNNTYIHVINLNSEVVFEEIYNETYAIYNIRQTLYILTDSQDVTVKPTYGTDIKVCSKLTETDVEWTKDGDDVVFSVVAESDYEFVDGNKYYTSINDGGNVRYFWFTVNVSGETISISEANEITEYVA